MDYLFLIIAYLLGSISTSISLSKLMNVVDPRTAGSKNPGATNMLRTSGRLLGFLTLLGDACKGFVVVYVAQLLFDPVFSYIAALLVFLGHVYPVFYEFKGGKGVAVTLGILLALSYKVALIALLVWVVVFYCFKYSSLAAIIATINAAIIAFFIDGFEIGCLVALIAVLLIINHRVNLVRLINGTESKIKI